MQGDMFYLKGQFPPHTLPNAIKLTETALTALELHSPVRNLVYIYVCAVSASKVDLFSTLLACGVFMMCTVLGLTPLALVLLYRANLLFRLPRSPLGREPLYLLERGRENIHGSFLLT